MARFARLNYFLFIEHMVFADRIAASHNTHFSIEVYCTSLQHIWSDRDFDLISLFIPRRQFNGIFSFSNACSNGISQTFFLNRREKRRKPPFEAQLFTHVYTKWTRSFILHLQVKHAYVTRKHRLQKFQ